MKKYIPIPECVNGGFYRIDSRNLSFGVYSEKTKGFVGIREKFGDEYLFTEYHYDTGPPFGTVFPEELLERCPLEPNELISTIYTEEIAKTIRSSKKLGDIIRVENKELFAWLDKKRREYDDE